MTFLPLHIFKWSIKTPCLVFLHNSSPSVFPYDLYWLNTRLRTACSWITCEHQSLHSTSIWDLNVITLTSGIQLSTSDCTHQSSDFSKGGWLRTCDDVCTWFGELSHQLWSIIYKHGSFSIETKQVVGAFQHYPKPTTLVHNLVLCRTWIIGC